MLHKFYRPTPIVKTEWCESTVSIHKRQKLSLESRILSTPATLSCFGLFLIGYHCPYRQWNRSKNDPANISFRCRHWSCGMDSAMRELKQYTALYPRIHAHGTTSCVVQTWSLTPRRPSTDLWPQLHQWGSGVLTLCTTTVSLKPGLFVKE